jgi:alkanesulfonate monooxygenase SsuD/methylene tetrahydromethanopterin reductase-like flavin-dependent oxidoreductase (luciferase family)
MIGLKPSQQFTTIDTLRRAWGVAEEAGFDGLWTFDHFASLGPDPDGDVFEATALLAAMAQATTRIRIGCLVLGNTYRPAAVLAKTLVTIDHLSGGRLDVGLGAGGHHGDLGLPTGRWGALLDRLDEDCRRLKALWTGEAGPANPRPIQRPHPPLWIGSAGERRGLRVVAEHADGWAPGAPPGTDPGELARLSAVLDRHCEAIGRDPAEIRRCAQVRLPADADAALRTVEAHVAAGFPDVVLMPSGPGVAPAEAAAELLPRLRSLV